MKVAILAGGKGTRFSINGNSTPKPLAPIGGRPILWHIFKYYESFGFRDFVVALGHRGQQIRDYFQGEMSSNSNRRNGHSASNGINRTQGVNGTNGTHGVNGFHGTNGKREPWQIQFVDTGECTPTASRIRQLRPYLSGGTFMMTWSDGLANLDLHRLLDFHRSHKKLATVTAVHPPPRFGQLTLEGDCVTDFREKPRNMSRDWINGAYFVLEPGIFDYIPAGEVAWEKEPLEGLAGDGQLMAYRHADFWHCMDTVFEQQQLESFWNSGKAPWKTWN